MPDWYPLICAARALNVSPIELANSGIEWFQVGLVLAEAHGIFEEQQRRPKKGK